MQEEEVKGRARIYVPDEYAPKEARRPVSGECIYDTIELKDQFDLWEKHLCLPEGLSIWGIYYDLLRVSWLVIVESIAIPQPSRDQIIPEFLPIFQRLEDGTIQLVNLKL